VIAHRLATVQRADKIFVIEDGEIVETGKHPELMAKAVCTPKLHAIQFRDARADTGIADHQRGLAFYGRTTSGASQELELLRRFVDQRSPGRCISPAQRIQ